jgi:hypothetical protein
MNCSFWEKLGVLFSLSIPTREGNHVFCYRNRVEFPSEMIVKKKQTDNDEDEEMENLDSSPIIIQRQIEEDDESLSLIV